MSLHYLVKSEMLIAHCACSTIELLEKENPELFHVYCGL